jgi:hypothetical protein
MTMRGMKNLNRRLRRCTTRAESSNGIKEQRRAAECAPYPRECFTECEKQRAASLDAARVKFQLLV